jgi:hypothetical protein
MDGSLLSFVSRLTTPPAIGVRNNLVLPTRFLALALCNGRSNEASPSDSFAGFPDDDAAPDAEDAEDAVSPLASPAAAAPTSALAPLLPRARLAKTHDDDDAPDEDADVDVDAPTVIVAPCRCRPPITDAPPLHRGAACALPSADLAPPLLCPRRRPVVNPHVVVVTVVVVVVKHPCISFFY